MVLLHPRSVGMDAVADQAFGFFQGSSQYLGVNGVLIALWRFKRRDLGSDKLR